MTIEPGDHVTIGNGKVHWKVLEHADGGFGPDWWMLESGQTGRRKTGHIDNVELHTKAS
jgi:hypothetical protein